MRNNEVKDNEKAKRNMMYSKLFNHNTTSKEAVPDLDRFIAMNAAGETDGKSNPVRWIWGIGLVLVAILIVVCLGYRAWNHVVNAVNTFILERSGVEMQLAEPELLEMNMTSFENQAMRSLDYGKKDPVPYYYKYYDSWSKLPFTREEWEPAIEDPALRFTSYKLEVSEWDKIGKLMISVKDDNAKKSDQQMYEVYGYFKIAEYTPEDVVLTNKGDRATFVHEGAEGQKAYFIRNWMSGTYTVYFVIDDIFFEMEIENSKQEVEKAKQIVDALSTMPKDGSVKDNTLKVTIYGEGDWPWYTLEEAVDKAVTIVYGKAVEKSETKKHKISAGDWYTDYEYYKEVTIEVLENLKGDMDARTFTYFEVGGETEDVIRIKKHQEPVELGKEYIFLLNQYDIALSPQTLLPVEDGVVLTKGKVAPESKGSDEVNEISVGEYIRGIKSVLAD
jgi:hypothetical protein